jgi:N-acetylglutamate synthase-like GNAT family acetyltransferase
MIEKQGGCSMKENHQFTIHTDKEKLDIDVIYSYLHHESYWAKGIPLHLVQTSIEHSICFGVYDECDKQVGFGRIISDFATFAYLADVFILPHARGNGLGKALVQEMIRYQSIQHVRKILLATKDAHGLYSQYGFKEVKNKQLFMQIFKKGMYERALYSKENKILPGKEG